MPELEAGRELDARIAETVMGAKWEPFAGQHPRLFSEAEAGEWLLARKDANGVVIWTGINLPEYSTKIAAAWLVVERMRAAGWNFSCEDEGQFGPAWTAWFNRTLNRSEHPYAWLDSERGDAATAPHAICLAALAALAVLPSQQKGATAE